MYFKYSKISKLIKDSHSEKRDFNLSENLCEPSCLLCDTLWYNFLVVSYNTKNHKGYTKLHEEKKLPKSLIELIAILKSNQLGNSLLLLFFIISLPIILNAQTDWPYPRADQKLSGFTTYDFPENPDIKWSFKTEGEIKSSPVVTKEKVVVSSTDGIVYCLDTNGKLLWKFKSENAFEASPIVHHGKVYVGDLSGILYCLDLKDGRKIWTYTCDNQVMATANWWEKGDKSYILVGSYDFYLHCIDARTGKAVWKYELDNYLNGAVAISDGKAVFGGCDGFLHSVDIETGTLDSKYDIATYIAGSPLCEAGMAYVGDYDGFFYAIDLNEKKETWKFDNPDFNLPFIGSPAVYQDFLINTNRDKFVYCLNKNTGELIWKHNTGFKIDASPLVNKSAVLVVNMRGYIQVLNIKDGKLIHEFELGSPVFSNPAIAPNRIYLGAMDGNVYCLE
ncbi:MAG: PQQ-binding-like beta-propeller repeat protein [Bacteroidales bacterium]|nr:PQQ-binding-like beta-propeller repeat protein [Bacteroidales bacterium]MCF8456091.1 PQQ-binding-like beta-propeller repeat protein [Bacteroidales bacterium]